jgi:serine/threonine protein kinase
MSEVYRARDSRLGREVAIKTLPAERMADEGRRRRFVQEARAASALNHPNIVTIHEIESAEGVDFIVMEYVPGRTLDGLIPKHGMRLGEALRLAISIADALAAAHAREGTSSPDPGSTAPRTAATARWPSPLAHHLDA